MQPKLRSRKVDPCTATTAYRFLLFRDHDRPVRPISGSFLGLNGWIWALKYLRSKHGELSNQQEVSETAKRTLASSVGLTRGFFRGMDSANDDQKLIISM